MTTGTPGLPGSLWEKPTQEEPLPMEEEIMNTLQTLPAGEPATPSSQAPGLLRNTQAGMQDTPARHLYQVPDRNTQPHLQDSDRNNQLAMLAISAPHILGQL